MALVQTLSANILKTLTEFGAEKLQKALTPSEFDINEEREELLSLLDNEIYTYRPQFEITEKRPISLE